MWASVTVGAIGVVLGVVILVVDKTKGTVTYLSAGVMIVIGLGLVLGYLTGRGKRTG